MQYTLIFDYTLQGHHSEYLHHIYMAAGQKINENFIFIVPSTFEKQRKNMNWPVFQNIDIYYINDQLLEKLPYNFLKKSWFLSKLLNNIANHHKVNRILLIELITFFPFLPFLLNWKFKVSGIIYLIYLYRWKQSSMRGRLKDLFKYMLIKIYFPLKTVFILNDTIAPYYLNKFFHTSKFKTLADPYMPLDNTKLKDMRAELKIPADRKIILHFGALEQNKGTLDIFHAIRMMNPSMRAKYTFIFAGNVMKDIKNEFYQYYNELKKEIPIIIYDNFCPFELLGSLCLTCDAILIPYKRTCQSSGVIGYAAQFKKPVIAPKQGLLGKLVRRNHLGILIPDTKPEKIISALEYLPNWSYTPNTYLSQNSIEGFQNTILKF